MRFTHLIKLMLSVVIYLSAFVPLGDARSDPTLLYTIQMASFKQEQSALDAVKNLKQKNWDVFYRPIRIADQGTWYRLYINRYPTIQAAQTGIRNLRKQGIITEAYVRRFADTPPPGITAAISQQDPQLPVARPGKTSMVPPKSTVAGLDAGPAASRRSKQLIIRDIAVRPNNKEGDTAIIQADGYFWPLTQLNHDGGKTRLQVQIRNAGPFHKDISVQAGGGRYIQNGQVVYHADRDTLVLSLDLAGETNYRITQLFDRTENSFCLFVRK